MEAFWSRGWQCIKVAETSRRCNVATSPRRDVGSTYIEVNKRQRRDVSMSRRQRECCLSIIKSKKGDQNSRIEDRGSYKLGHGNESSSDIDLERGPDFCIFFFSYRKTDVL